jgi:hypothetical protein
MVVVDLTMTEPRRRDDYLSRHRLGDPGLGDVAIRSAPP